MSRRLLHLLTALSLLLALAMAGLWGRSYWHVEQVQYKYRVITTADGSACTDRSLRVGWELGRLEFRYVHEDQSGFSPDHFFKSSPPDSTGWRFEAWRVTEGWSLYPADVMGFLFESNTTALPNVIRGARHRYFIQELRVPHWFLVLLFSLLPALRVIRWQLRRRRAQQLGPDARPCPACGYDCRATPARCPECGQASHETVGDKPSTNEPPGDEPPSDQATNNQAMGRRQQAGR